MTIFNPLFALIKKPETMSKFDDHLTLCTEQFSQIGYPQPIDSEKLKTIAKDLGPSIYLADASLVSCSDTKESERVKKNFLKRKIGFTDVAEAELDKAIAIVCDLMSSADSKKYRVVFYYLLLDYFEKREQAESSISKSRGLGERKTQHTVSKGDTLYKIAAQYGLTVAELKILNGMKSDTIQLGAVLKISKGFDVTPIPNPPLNPSPPTSGKSYLDFRNAVSFSRENMGDYHQHAFSFINPQGQRTQVSFRDNYLKSTRMVYPQGIYYGGQHRPTLPSHLLASIGLTQPQANALAFVSQHEGCFDAVNSYDQAVFSFGFIQFVAWTKEGTPGSLNTLMQTMKTNEPQYFNKYFGQMGLNTEGGQVTVLNDSGQTLRGKEAWIYVQRNLPLTATFIQSAYEPVLQKEQLRGASDYVRQAVNMKIDFTLNGVPMIIPRITDVLTSEAALSMLISLCINLGGGGLKAVLQRALPVAAENSNLSAAWQLNRIDENKLLNTILTLETDNRIINRVNGSLSAFSTEKGSGLA
jgi:LysM repeat protein